MTTPLSDADIKRYFAALPAGTLAVFVDADRVNLRDLMFFVESDADGSASGPAIFPVQTRGKPLSECVHAIVKGAAEEEEA